MSHEELVVALGKYLQHLRNLSHPSLQEAGVTKVNVIMFMDACVLARDIGVMPVIRTSKYDHIGL